MLGLGRTGLKGILLHALTEDEVELIHRGALQTLAQTGIVVHDDATSTLLNEAGCQVDQEDQKSRAYIPAQVVEDAVAQAPPVVIIYNRLGEQAMALGTGQLHARTSSGATGILDLGNERRREATCQDAGDAARLADALPHIHGVSTMAVQPADIPVTTVDVHTVKVALANTVKPLGYVCLNEHLIEAVIAMVAVAVGGDENLRQRPSITALAESTSPLQLVPSQLAVLKAFASRGLPLTLHAHPMAGFTAPVTLAGELVITHAEVLALATIAQLIRPNTPVVYGMSSSVPDMRSGANLSGAVEIGLLGVAATQLARRSGLPCIMSSGSDAHRPGAQGVMERLMSLLPPALAGIDLVNLSAIDTKMTFSLEQLIIDETILSTVERYLRGITVDEETLALDLIQGVGPMGSFITEDHTIRHFRDELLTLGLIDHAPRKPWKASGAPDMQTRARGEVRRILAEHRPPPLPDGVAVRLDEIVEEVSLDSEKQ
jgi:trimethylamine--corrinoid protein Co-methyltransferase